MNDWIKTSERLPELPVGAPDYAMSVKVIGSYGDMATSLRYARNMYAKTDKGRAARWERWDGSLASPPDYWMSFPIPPKDES